MQVFAANILMRISIVKMSASVFCHDRKAGLRLNGYFHKEGVKYINMPDQCISSITTISITKIYERSAHALE